MPFIFKSSLILLSKLAITRASWRQFSRELGNASSWLDSGFLAGLFFSSHLPFFSQGKFQLLFSRVLRAKQFRTASRGRSCGCERQAWPVFCLRERSRVGGRLEETSSDERAEINRISRTFALALSTWHLTIIWYSVWRHDGVLKLGAYESQKLL